MVTDENDKIRIRNPEVPITYGFADPDPYQNVTDPQHCSASSVAILYRFSKIESQKKFGCQSCLKIQKQKFEYDGVYGTLGH